MSESTIERLLREKKENDELLRQESAASNPAAIGAVPVPSASPAEETYLQRLEREKAENELLLKSPQAQKSEEGIISTFGKTLAGGFLSTTGLKAEGIGRLTGTEAPREFGETLSKKAEEFAVPQEESVWTPKGIAGSAGSIIGSAAGGIAAGVAGAALTGNPLGAILGIAADVIPMSVGEISKSYKDEMGKDLPIGQTLLHAAPHAATEIATDALMLRVGRLIPGFNKAAKGFAGNIFEPWWKTAGKTAITSGITEPIEESIQSFLTAWPIAKAKGEDLFSEKNFNAAARDYIYSLPGSIILGGLTGGLGGAKGGYQLSTLKNKNADPKKRAEIAEEVGKVLDVGERPELADIWRNLAAKHINEKTELPASSEKVVEGFAKTELEKRLQLVKPWGGQDVGMPKPKSLVPTPPPRPGQTSIPKPADNTPADIEDIRRIAEEISAGLDQIPPGGAAPAPPAGTPPGPGTPPPGAVPPAGTPPTGIPPAGTPPEAPPTPAGDTNPGQIPVETPGAIPEGGQETPAQDIPRSVLPENKKLLNDLTHAIKELPEGLDRKAARDQARKAIDSGAKSLQDGVRWHAANRPVPPQTPPAGEAPTPEGAVPPAPTPPKTPPAAPPEEAKPAPKEEVKPTPKVVKEPKVEVKPKPEAEAPVEEAPKEEPKPDKSLTDQFREMGDKGITDLVDDIFNEKEELAPPAEEKVAETPVLAPQVVPPKTRKDRQKAIEKEAESAVLPGMPPAAVPPGKVEPSAPQKPLTDLPLLDKNKPEEQGELPAAKPLTMKEKLQKLREEASGVKDFDNFMATEVEGEETGDEYTDFIKPELQTIYDDWIGRGATPKQFVKFIKDKMGVDFKEPLIRFIKETTAAKPEAKEPTPEPKRQPNIPETNLDDMGITFSSKKIRGETVIDIINMPYEVAGLKVPDLIREWFGKDKGGRNNVTAYYDKETKKFVGWSVWRLPDGSSPTVAGVRGILNDSIRAARLRGFDAIRSKFGGGDGGDVLRPAEDVGSGEVEASDMDGLNIDAGKFVSSETAKLIRDGGEAAHMPEDVINWQIQDIALTIRAFENRESAFIIANAPGSGKTFLLGGIIRELKLRGQTRVIYVTMNRSLISQNQKDLEKYGVEVVDFYSYTKIRAEKIPTEGYVVIFDEAHSIKNIDKETKQALAGKEMMNDAVFTILSSATPAEKLTELSYMEPTGVFGEGGFIQWGKQFGLKVLQKLNKKTGKFQPVLVFNKKTGLTDLEVVDTRQPVRGKGLKKARRWLVEKGVYTNRPMKIPAEQVKGTFSKNSAEETYVNLYDQITEAYAIAGTQAVDGMEKASINMHQENLLKRLMESAKIDITIKETLRLLDEGRRVVTFSDYVSDKYLGRFRKSNDKTSDEYFTYPEMVTMYNHWMARKRAGSKEKAPFAQFIMKIAGAMHDLKIDTVLRSAPQEIMAAVENYKDGLYKTVEFTGKVSDVKAKQALDSWLSGNAKFMMASIPKGGTGLSLHDKVGDQPTAQVVGGLPWTATKMMQLVGRTARYGMAGDVEQVYIFSDNIPYDMALAKRLAKRMQDLGSLVQGIDIKGADKMEIFDFEHGDEADMSGFTNQDVITEVPAAPELTPEEKNRGKIIAGVKAGERLHAAADFAMAKRFPEGSAIRWVLEHGRLNQAEALPYLKEVYGEKQIPGLFRQYLTYTQPGRGQKFAEAAAAFFSKGENEAFDASAPTDNDFANKLIDEYNTMFDRFSKGTLTQEERIAEEEMQRHLDDVATTNGLPSLTVAEVKNFAKENSIPENEAEAEVVRNKLQEMNGIKDEEAPFLADTQGEVIGEQEAEAELNAGTASGSHLGGAEYARKQKILDEIVKPALLNSKRIASNPARRGVIRGMSLANPSDSREVETLLTNILAKVFGKEKELLFVKLDDLEGAKKVRLHGVFVDKKWIVVNVNSDFMLSYIFAHEQGHSPKDEAALIKVIKKTVSKEKFDRFAREWKKTGLYDGEQIWRELKSELVASEMHNPAFWESLQKESNSLYQKMVNWINHVAKALGYKHKDLIAEFAKPEEVAALTTAVREFMRAHMLRIPGSTLEDSVMVSGEVVADTTDVDRIDWMTSSIDDLNNIDFKPSMEQEVIYSNFEQKLYGNQPTQPVEYPEGSSPEGGEDGAGGTTGDGLDFRGEDFGGLEAAITNAPASTTVVARDGNPYTYERKTYGKDGNLGFNITAKDKDGNSVGAAILTPTDGGKSFKVEFVQVNEEFRGNRIGEEIQRQANNYARSIGKTLGSGNVASVGNQKIWDRALAEDRATERQGKYGMEYDALENFMVTEEETDQMTTAEEALDIAKSMRDNAIEAKDEIKAILNPVNMNDPVSMIGAIKRQAGIIRDWASFKSRENLVAGKKLRKYDKMLTTLTKKQSEDAINFFEQEVRLGRTIDSFPSLAALPQNVKDDLKELSKVRSEIIEPLWRRVMDQKGVQTFIVSYFPHFWKDPRKAAQVFSDILGKRPAAGSERFLNLREIDFIEQGLAAGLELESTDPVDNILRITALLNKSIMWHEVKKESIATGLWVKNMASKFGGGLPELTDKNGVPIGWVKIDDKSALVRKVSPGKIETFAEYYAPAPIARVVNNYLSPGLYKRSKIYDITRHMGNAMNSIQLSFSMFHAMFTSMDAVAGSASVGLQEVLRGDIQKGLTRLTKSIFMFPVVPIQLWKAGKKFEEDVMNNMIPGTRMYEAFQASGGRLAMDQFYKLGAMHSFRTALRKGNKLHAAGLAPFYAVEAAAIPVMELWVPRIKVGMFMEMMQSQFDHWDKQGISPSREELRNTGGDLWNSVENRMGQLAYDNLFWKKTFKDLAMISTRSVGWNLGTIREFGGAISDLRNIKKGKHGIEISSRLAYAATMPFIVGMVGAIIMKLGTGEPPEELKDYFYPRTGRKRPDGEDERLSIPSYMKDIYPFIYYTFTGQPGKVGTMASHKLHPLISAVSDMMRNSDYFGTEIRDSNDPFIKQMSDAGAYLSEQMLPFSVRGAQVATETTMPGAETTRAATAAFLGLNPAPKYITMSRADEAMNDYFSTRRDTGISRETMEERKAKGKMTQLLRMGRGGEARELKREFGLTNQEWTRQVKKSKTDAKLNSFKGLGDVETAVRVYQKADDAERRLFRKTLMNKISNSTVLNNREKQFWRREMLKG